MIRGYARIDRVGTAVELVEELEKLSLLDEVQVLTLGSLIDSLSKTRSRTVHIEYAIEKAEWMLGIIVAKYEKGQVKRNEKNVDSWVFENVIRLWSRRHTLEAAERIKVLIDQMEQLNEKYPKLFQPLPNIYLLAMDAWASSGHESAGKEAMAILRKVPEPNTRFLASALSSVSRSSGRGIVKTAESLYQQILELYKQGDRSASVNARTLTTLLSAILRAPEPEMTERALHVLRQTLLLGKENLDDLAPNTIAFNCLLNGLAKRAASDEAWDLFQEMKSLLNLGYDSAPDAASYACLVRAISMDRDTSTAINRLDGIVLEIQEKLSEGSMKGDTPLFNSLIKSYAHLSKDDERGSKKAYDLLKQLELSTFGDNNMSPDLVTYRNVCEACAMSKAADSADMAEEIFHKARKAAETDQIDPVSCDLVSYVVLALTRSKAEDALERAENFIEDLEEPSSTLLNTRSYNTLLSAYANSNDPKKVGNALRIFKKLNNNYQKGHRNCLPDTNSFNWVRHDYLLLFFMLYSKLTPFDIFVLSANTCSNKLNFRVSTHK